MDLLKEVTNIYGLELPWFIVIFSLILIAFTGIKVCRLVLQSRRINKSLDTIVTQVDTLLKQVPKRKNQEAGISQVEVNALRDFFESSNSEPLLDSWIDYESQFVHKSDSKLYWASTPADRVFTEANVVSLNRNWYSSIPGIVTGFGLLLTFLAILVALLDVKVIEGQVEGVDKLISGLSGKFASSVVALLLATVFVIIEKNIFQRVNSKRVKLVSLLDRKIPQLSSTQVLVDISNSISQLNSNTSEHFIGLKQEFETTSKNVENLNISVQDLGTSLVPLLVQGVGESVTPTISRMVDTIEELNKFLRRAEETRNNQLNDTVTGLLSQLKDDLSKAFGEMSGNFRESLSGSTQGQFETASQTLGDTANLLASMNAQFESSQKSMQGVMCEVSATMKQLMGGLSSQVEYLGQQMSDAVRENSQTAVSAAQGVVTQVNQLSVANEERLSKLLITHDTQLMRVEKTSESLETLIVEFNGLISGLRQTSETSALSVSTITTTAGLIGDAANKASEVHQQLGMISERLKESHERQEDVWEGISENISKYHNLFRETEGSATTLLDQIATNLHNYQEVTQNGFNGLVQTADEHFTNAVQRLKATVDELGVVLEDLTEQLENFNHNGNRQ